MKPLAPTEMAPRQQLVRELTQFAYSHELSEWEVKDIEDGFNAVLSPYEIKKSELTSVNLEIDPDLVGKMVDINYHPGEATEQFYKGKVISIFFRETPVDIDEYLKVLLMVSNEEYKRTLTLSMKENLRETIYHRIVLKDEKQGVVIIPYLKGVTITKYIPL